MLDFYYLPGSAPCRAVQMVAEAVHVKLNLKYLDLMAGAHRSPQFTKLNPQRTIPTLVDGSLVLSESRAALIYLCDQYGDEDNDWYPRDTIQRAIVNQRLFFDACVLYPRFADFYHPQVFGNAAPDGRKRLAFEKAVELLNIFLSEHEFVAGSKMTIADISLFATLATACTLGFILRPYVHVDRWYVTMVASCPGAQANVSGAKEFLTYK
ncbi:glutathione S-transferase 2 [Anopheles gambiae]|uniref:glutathione S-transferase 2 n=1 Tax=Anopheles gambiae TaxID=7165 RepID=UPI000012BD29|nr:glutathione S-transferase 2 [Anopheles gambiae]CAA96104.1 GSTD2 protein [Anopheles gambiae]